jgi:hypothetical protein
MLITTEKWKPALVETLAPVNAYTTAGEGATNLSQTALHAKVPVPERQWIA